MSVNGITSGVTNASASTYASKASSTPKAPETKAAESAEASASTSQAAINATPATYEKNDETSTKPAGYNKTQRMSEEDRANLVQKLKEDQAAREQNLVSIVQSMMTDQGKTYNTANDIWGFLREGNFTVDAATKKQAQEDISEDGYWGVKQTSGRILDFADALMGSDSTQIQKMYDAFKKGYAEAEKTWGGELPEISKQTYDAVLKGFQERAEAAGVTLSDD